MFARLFLAAAFLNSVSAAFPFSVAESHGTTRRLEDADAADFTWMNGYSVMYENCFPSQSLATFRLCPSDSTCRADCSGAGEYVLDLATFVDSFTEAQMGGREYRCEMARENCAYDDDALCYQESGLDYCTNNNEDEFNLQEWIECTQFSDDYYVGPYCAGDNYNIHLGLFTDADCTAAADVSFSETFGYVLEYSAEAGQSIIADECADCKEHKNEEDQDEDDAADEDDVIEQCEEMYEMSSKCEENLDTEYEDDNGCSYIEELKVSEKVTSGQPTSTNKSSAGKVFLIIFLIILAIAAIYACYWFAKRRQSASTSASEGLMS